MAKKVSRPAQAAEVSPGVNPYDKPNAGGKRMGTLLGAVCLILFIITDELWIGTLACALGFALIFAVQVFVEKSKTWYASIYLYAFVLSLVLAWAEYRYDFITEIMKIG